MLPVKKVGFDKSLLFDGNVADHDIMRSGFINCSNDPVVNHPIDPVPFIVIVVVVAVAVGLDGWLEFKSSLVEVADKLLIGIGREYVFGPADKAIIIHDSIYYYYSIVGNSS